MKRLGYLLLLTVLGCCTVKKDIEISPTVDENQTRAVLRHHMDAFLANDLDAIMSDYTEESVLITPDSTFKGLEAIRQNFANAFTIFPKDSSSMTLRKSVVKQDVAYVIWEAKTPTFSLPFGTDTFIIQNGKIVRQTFAAAPGN